MRYYISKEYFIRLADGIPIESIGTPGFREVSITVFYLHKKRLKRHPFSMITEPRPKRTKAQERRHRERKANGEFK